MSLYRVVVGLLRPYTALMVLLGLALANLWRRRRESRPRLLLATVPYLGLAAVSLPPAAYLALGSLEWQNPPAPPGRPADAGAIVVLTGSMAAPDRVRPVAELAGSSLVRCVRAAEVYRAGGPCPVLVSGGKVSDRTPGPPCAEVMGQLLRQLGVPAADVEVEGRSHNTAESAVECARLLRRRGVGKIVLVTEATHLPRALGCFRKQGIAAVPSGCHYRATEFRISPSALLPNTGALQDMLEASHEWLGLLWYRLHGRA